MPIRHTLQSLRADAVFGWRQLLKKKATSSAAILSLALAVGACTAAFRLVDALLLRPLPVSHPERLHVVSFENVGPDGKPSSYDSCSYPVFRLLRAAVHGQAETIAVSYTERIDLTYGSDQDMEKAYRQFVSGWMFRIFGLRPATGRLLTDDDDSQPGAHPVAVLSYDYWSRRFARDPHVVGRGLRIGDTLYQMVGVAAEGFTGTETGAITDVFLPMMMKNPRTLASSNNFWLRTLVELQPGVAAAPVGEWMRATFRAAQEERARNLTLTPLQRSRFFSEKLLLEPASAGSSNLQRDYRRPLTALGILVLLVLLIACANVANLMTAQAAAREREMALRVAIGAGRGRLVQLVLLESAWIAFLATAAGAAFAWWSAPVIAGMINPPDNPARLVLPADWRVFGFAVVLALAITFLFGLAPALRASAVQPVRALRGGADPHARRRLMHALVALQITFCFVVHFVSGLFLATFDRLVHQPNGFSAERILNLETVTAHPQPAALWEQVTTHLRAVPGVEAAALVLYPLMSGESSVGDIATDGGPVNPVFSDFLSVSPGWMDVMKIRWLAGRDFRAADTGGGIAVVNESFAKQYFNSENPVGRFFERVASGQRTRFQVVGLVADARIRDDMRRAIRPTAYLPLADSARGAMVVRTAAANPLALASLLRQEVARARPEFRVSTVRTQVELNQQHTVRERLLATLAVFFAAAALLLAGVGLYGVLDYSVLQRRREIGIRMAIGAQAFDIARRVTAQVFSMVLAGAVAGLVLGMASVRSIESLLYQVKATDLGMLALPSVTILAAALVASLPAIARAVRTDPATVLRGE